MRESEHRLARWCHGDTGPSFPVTPGVYLVRAVVFGIGALAGLVGVLCALGLALWNLPLGAVTTNALTLWLMWVPFVWFVLLVAQPNRVPKRLGRDLK